MNDTPYFPLDDADPWTIPLHGALVPTPANADVPAPTPPLPEAPGADSATILDFPGSDEVPSDVGFHPHLRRSA